MPAEPVKYIGDKLCVGPVDYSFIPFTPAIPGSSVLNGPVWIGVGVPVPTANCMIGPGLLNPITLEVKGISNFFGITNQVGAYFCTGASIFNGAKITNGPDTVNGSHITNASKVINGALVVNGATHINGFLTFTSSIVGTTKNFDISHPTKNGWRLSHSCLEGPEVGVYFRGRLINKNIIELPDYWKGLVDSETITVSFTPHRYYQELYVKSIDLGTKITVLNNSGGEIDCSYIVFAERKDVKKLVVEYVGTEPKENCTIKE